MRSYLRSPRLSPGCIQVLRDGPHVRIRTATALPARQSPTSGSPACRHPTSLALHTSATALHNTRVVAVLTSLQPHVSHVPQCQRILLHGLCLGPRPTPQHCRALLHETTHIHQPSIERSEAIECMQWYQRTKPHLCIYQHCRLGPAWMVLAAVSPRPMRTHLSSRHQGRATP